MCNGNIVKRVHVGECMGSRSIGRPRKRWIDSVSDCLKKEVWMLCKQGEWCMIGGISVGQCLGSNREDESLIMTR